MTERVTRRQWNIDLGRPLCKTCDGTGHGLGGMWCVPCCGTGVQPLPATDPTCEHGEEPVACYRCYQLDVLEASRK